MLKVKDLNVHYGKIHAIKGISFEVNEGEIVTLIGANGAGKTTILQTISGLLKPSEGMISFEGENLNKVPAHQIPVMGIAHVPEGRRIFAEMTVYENLQMGAYIRNDKVQIQEDMEKIFLNFPRLKERIKQIAGTLSGGERLRAGLAIVFSGPKPPQLLVLDEPTNHLDLESLEELERALMGYDGALLIVSHDDAFLETIGAGRHIALC